MLENNTFTACKSVSAAVLHMEGFSVIDYINSMKLSSENFVFLLKHKIVLRTVGMYYNETFIYSEPYNNIFEKCFKSEYVWGSKCHVNL